MHVLLVLSKAVVKIVRVALQPSRYVAVLSLLRDPLNGDVVWPSITAILSRPPIADSGPRQRRRTIRACVPGRQAKRKCDGARPCSTRARFNMAVNTSSRKDPVPRISCLARMIFPPLSVPPPTKQRLRWLRTLSLGEDESIDHRILSPEKARLFRCQFRTCLFQAAWDSIRCERSCIQLPHQIRACTECNGYHTVHRLWMLCVATRMTASWWCNRTFIRRASQQRWKGIPPTEDSSDFDVVICGVAALGYFVSQETDNGMEAALTSFAEERLGSVTLGKSRTVDLIAAWAQYLRATSRPHAF